MLEARDYGRLRFSFRLLVVGIIAAGVALQASSGAAQLLFSGVNLSGAEFGAIPTPGNTGVYGTDYTYPTKAEVDYFISKGMNTFRLPFRWERLQPTLDGALDNTELTRLNNFVSYATSHGAFVILDPHNFARYYPDPNNFESSTQGLIGSASVPNSAFADLWSRLATDYKGNTHVIFGLMNEPNSMPTEQWVSAANAGIAAIRSAGASNLVLVPGNAWTGASSWSDNWYGTPNATALLNITDPSHNFAIEAHQYLDADGSGTSSQIANNDTNIGVERLTGFTQWLTDHHLRGFLGEYAVANSTIGAAAGQIGDETLTNMLNYVQAHSNVWLGSTWWAAGPWWGEYQFTLEPKNLGTPSQTDRPAMTVLQPYQVGIHTPGDVNFDGIVNGLDISLIGSHWLQTGSGTPGDANYDGLVNGTDIALLAAHWLQTSGSGAAAPVPEPSTLVLAACAALGGLARIIHGPRKMSKGGYTH